MNVIFLSSAAESTALTVGRLICLYLRATVAVSSEDLKMLDASDLPFHSKGSSGAQ